MAKLKSADVPPAMPEPDIAADLDGLAAASAAAASCNRGTTTTTAAEGHRAPMVVIGHRGKGMNALAASPDPRLRGDVRENTLRAFNDAAASHPAVAYVEFDVQVTKDGCPVIFHDNFIYTQQGDQISGKRVTDLDLDEFLSYGKAGKPLFRKLKDGRILRWDVRSDDALCTLRPSLPGRPPPRRLQRRAQVRRRPRLHGGQPYLHPTSRPQGRLRARRRQAHHLLQLPPRRRAAHPQAARQVPCVLPDERRDAGLRRPAPELAGGGRQALRRRRAAGDRVGGPRDTPAAVGGGHDQGDPQAVADDLRPAQQRAGGGVRAAPDGGGRRHRRPGAGDRRGRVGVHGHDGRAGAAGLPGQRRRRGGREDGDGRRGGGSRARGRDDAELLAAGDVLPPEAHPRASAVACCCSCWWNRISAMIG